MTARLPTVGVDIGATKIGVGLVERGGRIIRHQQIPTPAREGAEAILSAVTTTMLDVVDGQPIGGIGIGAAGVIGPRGVVVSATNLLSGWVGTDVVGAIHHGLRPYGIDCPVVAVNDVHAHGAGEALCGAGAGTDLVLLIAVGTGLGGAVIHHGRPLIGAHGASGHLGHIRCREAAALPCSCGATGHLEAIASGYGLVQLYHKLGGDKSISSAQVISRRVHMDSVADTALSRSAAALGAAIGDLINIVDPDLVVISGSVSQAGSTWWREVRIAAKETCLNVATDSPVVPATLGEHAGVIGAASLAARAAAEQESLCRNH